MKIGREIKIKHQKLHHNYQQNYTFKRLININKCENNITNIHGMKGL
jgi:hypothetical protein